MMSDDTEEPAQRPDRRIGALHLTDRIRAPLNPWRPQPSSISPMTRNSLHPSTSQLTPVLANEELSCRGENPRGLEMHRPWPEDRMTFSAPTRSWASDGRPGRVLFEVAQQLLQTRLGHAGVLILAAPSGVLPRVGHSSRDGRKSQLAQLARRRCRYSGGACSRTTTR